MAKRATAWWEALRWKPAYGPERPGYLYSDARSVPLDKRSRSQLRLAMGNPPLNSAGSCVSCGARIYAATEPEWKIAVKQPCPRCGRLW